MTEDLHAGRDATFRTLYLGQAALRLMRGAARKEDVEAVLCHLIAEMEIEVQSCASTLFAASDLNSKDAQDAHFRGRVAASILHRFNQCIAAGEEAAAIIREEYDHD
jgi:hypothetical protein